MKTEYDYRIERNYDAFRNPESTHTLITTVGGLPHGVIYGDLEHIKMMGETFKRAGVYYLLPFKVE